MYAGQRVACPRCSQPFDVPAFHGLIEPPEPQLPSFAVGSREAPNVFISTSHKPLPRLKPSGWFSNAYGATMGVLLAILTVTFLSCGGLIVLGTLAQPAPEPRSKVTIIDKRIRGAPELSSSRVTAANFARVKAGMSRGEVFAILGPGELLPESSILNVTTQMYTWDGDSLGANCNVMFQNDEVISKAQFGL
jgi:hypothetical protein